MWSPLENMLHDVNAFVCDCRSSTWNSFNSGFPWFISDSSVLHFPISNYPNLKCLCVDIIIVHYLDMKCHSFCIIIFHPILKCPSIGIIILHYLNLKCHSVAIINSLSLSEMPLCWHHYLALSQPRSNFAPRGRITPMGGLPYKASILNHN